MYDPSIKMDVRVDTDGVETWFCWSPDGDLVSAASFKCPHSGEAIHHYEIVQRDALLPRPSGSPVTSTHESNARSLVARAVRNAMITHPSFREWRQVRGIVDVATERDELMASLKAMCAEFRGHDLPYGSEAYEQANSLINRIERGGA